MARPTKFKPEFISIAKKMCAMGATDAELADAFQVNTSTIWRWQSENAEFCSALKAGKSDADDRVERSLYQRAVGFALNSEKIFCTKGKVTRAEVIEHNAPDVTACIFWLKNRRRNEWRDRQELEHSGKDGGPAIELIVTSRTKTAAKSA